MNYYYVYILECFDLSYYTGVTNDLECRLREHREGVNPECYTYSRRPFKLVHVECFTDIKKAIAREKQIKRWSRRKKQALIAGNQNNLKFFAKRKPTRESIIKKRKP